MSQILFNGPRIKILRQTRSLFNFYLNEKLVSFYLVYSIV